MLLHRRLLLAAILVGTSPAHAIDWETIPGKDITLFYPAQLSWEWLTNDDEHSGAEKIADGRTCRSCHDGKEGESGSLLVDYKPTEPSIIQGKPGSIRARVKTGYDAQNLFIQVQFNTAGQPDALQDKSFPDKIAVMIDDGGVEEAKRVGCWAACHDDAVSMKNATPERTKYIENAGGARTLEYWQARLTPGKSPRAVDGTISNQRLESKTPAVRTDATFESGTWTVVFSRTLTAPERKAFVAGKTYTLGFAIHAGHTAQRFHYVSLEKTLMLDNGPADLIAAKQ